jgi:glycosyltransferase involved in cell wall biosynthesis
MKLLNQRRLEPSLEQKNLLIISAMPHFKKGGQIVGWAPTAEEINQLATIFKSIRHIACLHPGTAPNATIPYASPRIVLVPVPPAGGDDIWSKVKVCIMIPRYCRTMLKEIRNADVVHVRCPANISLIAIVLLSLIRRPFTRWVKYAGNWSPRQEEPLSYRFQRWWLKRGFHRGVVTVNGKWHHDPQHVSHFLNPCLTQEELESASRVANDKNLARPLVLVYAGRLEAAKGVGRCIQILWRLREKGIDAILNLAGDGPERRDFEKEATRLGVGDVVRFHGWLARGELLSFYQMGHFFVMPCSSSEGWPKVISEAMAYGVVPLAGNISSIPQLLTQFKTGKALDPLDITAFVESIVEYSSKPSVWKAESQRAVQAARNFSYVQYLGAVKQLLGPQEGSESV